MPLLLETIKIDKGDIYNLFYHQQRIDKSRCALLGKIEQLKLSSYIQPPKNGLYRCRILYDTKIQSIEYIPYKSKPIQRVKIITSTLNYDYKYANRDLLNALLPPDDTIDDILIEKNGYLTDTTIANIALYTGKEWVTPKKPLLEGTMRQKLLDSHFLTTANIKKEELQNFSHIALMNAMIGFKIVPSLKIEY